ncbi:helix-turn-helix transcriptional regulator [Tenacibaculum maritimum]|nr:helix-turn-helix transcriptional regulator [Tenacibaculum maritimum]MDB0600276.1 helix-turn-helix transcriptional regulator [Tenacibaculum maritimum]MDB0610786.1 helix-turn-helix transcriptional regulator [Tenacibaculum maritimum]
MSIASKIKELRIVKGYSLKNLSDLLGVSKSAVQQYENGSTKPSNIVLKEIASVLGADIWEFFDTENRKVAIESIKFRDGHKLINASIEKKN